MLIPPQASLARFPLESHTHPQSLVVGVTTGYGRTPRGSTCSWPALRDGRQEKVGWVGGHRHGDIKKEQEKLGEEYRGKEQAGGGMLSLCRVCGVNLRVWWVSECSIHGPICLRPVAFQDKMAESSPYSFLCFFRREMNLVVV